MKSFVLVVIISLLSLSVLAQTQPIKPPIQPPPAERQKLNQEITFGRELMRQGNYEGAAAYLETLYEKNAQNVIIINLLKQCYDHLAQYTKSITLLERYLAVEPNNLTYHMALAESLAKIGETDSAKTIYLKVADIIGDKNYLRYQTMLQSMINNDMGDFALSLIDSWREKFDDSLLFAAQKGDIYLRNKEYQKGLDELYPLLSDTSVIGRSVESKFAEVLSFVDSRKIGEDYFLNRPDLYQNARALDILSDHYLKTDQTEKAFNLTLSLDTLDNFRGDRLYRFMRTCADRKLYGVAKRMGDYILEHNSQALRYPLVYFGYAEALTHLGEYEKALTVYDSAFVLYNNRRDRGDALYNIGLLYFEHLNDYNKAYIYFDSVLNGYRNGISFYNSLIFAPRALLSQGKLDEATNKFKRATAEQLSTDNKEEIDYYLSLIQFFKKDYDSSQAGFNKLLVDYPKGYFVNDALKLIMLIDDAGDNREILYDYSNALLFEQKNQPDSTIYYLDKVAKTSQPGLADLALYRLMSAYLAQSDTTSVLSTIERVEAEFPESYYRPFCIKTKADIYLEQKKVEPASELYKKLLLEYPNYPFISEVRDILRGLESGSA